MPEEPTTPLERLLYWPGGKARWNSPKARITRALIDVFGVVFCAMLGGMNLAMVSLIGDDQGLLVTHSNAGLRFHDLILGLGLIFIALAIAIVRFVVAPVWGDRQSGNDRID